MTHAGQGGAREEGEQADAFPRAADDEESFRLLFERNPQPMWVYDPQSLRFLAVNDRACLHYGYSRDEFLAMRIFDIRPADELPRLALALSTPQHSLRVSQGWRHRRKDGSIILVEIASHALPFAGRDAILVVVTDVTERTRAEEALRRSELRYRRLVETALEGIWEVDAGDRTTFVNGAMASMLGYTPDEMLGRPLLDFYPDEDRAAALTRFAQRRDGVSSRMVLRLLRRDGTILWVRVSASPLFDDGVYLGNFALLTDITGERRAEEEALELARMRADFVAAVSHELRTPLTSILGYVELLQSRWTQLVDERRLDYLGHTAHAVTRQLRLVDDLLLLSQIQDTAFSVQCRSVPLADLVRSAAQEIAGSYAGQRIELDGPDDAAVVADPARATQVIVNLLDNAAKYSAEGMPVQAIWHSEGDHAVVRVRDRGPGISEAGRAYLFTRFGRVPESRARRGRVGTGLGLYLGRQLAELMRGSLDLEQSGPAGSVFCLRLPLASDNVSAVV